MSAIIPDITDSEQVQMQKAKEKRKPSAAFKELIEEISEEKEQKECLISIFELPRSHFSLPEEELQVEEEEINWSAALPTPTLSSLSECTSLQADIKTSSLSTEIDLLFEKMAGTILVLSSSQETETTLFLDSALFEHSPLYGAQITIKEFRTAPKAFNIQIAASSAALVQIDAHKAALLSAFARGNFNFSIGRLDTEIQTEDRPLFHRKEAVSQDQEDLTQ